MRQSINDGFTFFAENDQFDFRMTYRPIIASERRELGLASEVFGMDKVNNKAIQDHLVACTGDKIPDNLNLKKWMLSTMRMSAEDEQRYVNFLSHGVQILYRWPAVGNRSCSQCKLYQFDELTGNMIRDRHSEPVPRSKQPEHLKGPPCDWPGQQCPKGHYDDPKGFDESTRLAYVFHMECKAVNDWPRDPIVRRNARIIEDAIEKANGKLDR